MNLAQESAQKTEKADLLADKARLQAKVQELTIHVADAVRKGQAMTVKNFPAKYTDLQVAHSQLFDKYTTLSEKYKTCGATETAFQKCKKELSDVPKIKAKMVSKLVTKLKEARALILRAKESVVKAKTSAPNSEIQEVKAQDARLITAAKDGEARAQREAKREEMKARDAEAAVGPEAKEIAAKDEKGMNIKLNAIKSEEDRIVTKDHELREKNTADETKIQGLEAKAATSTSQGVPTKKFNAMQEGLEHKLRVEEREMSREEENAEAQVTKAKNEAAVAKEELKMKAQGVEPEDYAKALSEAKAEKEKLVALQAEFKEKLESQRQEDAEKLKQTEEAAKAKEEKMESVANEKVIEATGLRAAKDAAALARRRSSDSKMEKLLGKIQNPDPLPGKSDDVIPDNMENALENANPATDISELKEKLAEKLKQTDIENVEKARTASSDEQIEKIKSKLAFKKAAYAAIEAGKAKTAERDAKSKMRKLTAQQTLAKVREGAMVNALTKLKAKLADSETVEEAKTLKKAINTANQRVQEARGAYTKAAAAVDTQLDAARTAAEKQVTTAQNAATAKVNMANTVANARRAKILIAKVDLVKAEEVVSNAREGRNMVYKALEAALSLHTPEGQAKADKLKAVLTNMESVINTARTSVEEARKTVMQDEAESIRADANEKLANAEASSSTENSRNALKAKMTALIEQTKDELEVPDTKSVEAAQSVQVVYKGSANTTKTVHVKGDGQGDGQKQLNIDSLKSALKTALKSEIGNVMQHSKGSTPAMIKARLKRKLKQMIRAKVAASHASKTTNMPGMDSSDPAVKAAAQTASEDQTQVSDLSRKAQSMQSEIDELRAELRQQQAKVAAAASAAKADVMAHSKAMVAEKLDPSSSTRHMAQDSANAAAGAVKEARSARQAATADEAKISQLKARLAGLSAKLRSAQQGAVNAESEVATKSVDDAQSAVNDAQEKVQTAVTAKQQATAALAQAKTALQSARATGNQAAIQSAKAMRSAAVESQQASAKDLQDANNGLEEAERTLDRTRDQANEMTKSEQNVAASGINKIADGSATAEAATALQAAKQDQMMTKQALERATVENQNAQTQVSSAQSSGDANAIRSAEERANISRAALQAALAADNAATAKADTAARALSRSKTEAANAAEDAKNSQIAETSRSIESGNVKISDLKLQVKKTDEDIVNGQRALDEAHAAMDKSKHAMAVAQQAGLVDATTAAKTMMESTGAIVGSATSKLAASKNKKQELLDEIARQEETNSAAASHIDTLKGVSTGSSMAASSETTSQAKQDSQIAEAELLRRESAAQKAQENVAHVTKAVHEANLKADAVAAQEIANADAVKAKTLETARAQKEAKDSRAEMVSQAAEQAAAAKSAAVDAQTSPQAASVAATAAEAAQRDANNADIERKETEEADKVEDQQSENAAHAEALEAVANAKQAAKDVKDAGAKQVTEAKNLARIAQQKATEAREAVENGDKINMSGDDIQAQIDDLKAKLKETSDVNEMVKIFDHINKLKNQENNEPVGQNSEKVQKLRINKAQESSEKATLNNRERSEKAVENAKTEAQLVADRAIKASNDAESKTRELARKQIDKIKSEEAKKTEAAEKEADSLKTTLSGFVQTAHDKLFSTSASEQMAADKAAAEAKAQSEAAEEEFKKAKLASGVANTKEAAAAEHLKGIMQQISESSDDKDKLTALSQQAQASKSNVMATRAAAQAAATALAEKQQAMIKFQIQTQQKEKSAEKEDAKVADRKSVV